MFSSKISLNSVHTLKIVCNATLAAARCMPWPTSLDIDWDRWNNDALHRRYLQASWHILHPIVSFTNIGVHYLLKGIFCSSAFTTFCVLTTAWSQQGLDMRGSTVGSMRRWRPKKLWKDQMKLAGYETDGSDQGDAKGKKKWRKLASEATTTLGIKPWYSVSKYNAYSIFSLRLPCWQLKNKYPVSLQHNFAVS